MHFKHQTARELLNRALPTEIVNTRLGDNFPNREILIKLKDGSIYSINTNSGTMQSFKTLNEFQDARDMDEEDMAVNYWIHSDLNEFLKREYADIELVRLGHL